MDLNLQFPAGWEQAKKIKRQQNYYSPAPRDFVGFKPLSEPESLAMYTFTLKHKFNLVIAYHTQGEEIYWNYKKEAPSNGFYIAKAFAKESRIFC